LGNVTSIKLSPLVNTYQAQVDNFSIDHIFFTDDSFDENILETYLPHWWTEDPIVEAFDKTLAINRSKVAQFRNDLNIQTASDNAIAVWEEWLGFSKNNLLTQKERRARLLTLVQGGEGTVASIKAKAEEITGNPVQLFERYKERDVSDDDIFTYNLLVEDPVVGEYDSDFLLEEIEKITPAHCTVQISFAVTVEDVATTPSEDIAITIETGFIYDDGTLYDSGKVYL